MSKRYNFIMSSVLVASIGFAAQEANSAASQGSNEGQQRLQKLFDYSQRWFDATQLIKKHGIKELSFKAKLVDIVKKLSSVSDGFDDPIGTTYQDYLFIKSQQFKDRLQVLCIENHEEQACDRMLGMIVQAVEMQLSPADRMVVALQSASPKLTALLEEFATPNFQDRFGTLKLGGLYNQSAVILTIVKKLRSGVSLDPQELAVTYELFSRFLIEGGLRVSPQFAQWYEEVNRKKADFFKKLHDQMQVYGVRHNVVVDIIGQLINLS